jgi:anti-anti-sigma factor
MLEVYEQLNETLRLVGELDAATAPHLQRRLEEHRSVTRLDLRDVTFVDSSGLRVLLLASRASGADGLILLEPSGHVRRVLEMTGLVDAFRIQSEPR